MLSSAGSFSGAPYTSQEKGVAEIGGRLPVRRGKIHGCVGLSGNKKAAASGNSLSLPCQSVPARTHNSCDSKFNSIHARRRQALHKNGSSSSNGRKRKIKSFAVFEG